MNVLFLTMSSQMADISTSGIYTDLMRKFKDEGHDVYIMYPSERRYGRTTGLSDSYGIHFLNVRTLNVSKTNIIEKGLGQVLLEYQFKSALKKYWSDIAFDLILYSTPPITFTNVIKYAKQRNPKALAYLLLKDIFPQNAVDIHMLSTTGIKGILYRSFRKKEQELYRISDYIGCMSPANVDYLIKHNPQIDPNIVEIAPNSYNPTSTDGLTASDKDEIRQRYNLPTDKPIFIYGGNLGRPQGIPFLIECLNANKDRKDCHFVIVGKGTEYPKLEAWMQTAQPTSVSLFSSLPKSDYDKLAGACDVGLIFLDYRFTIPNFPSRLLAYIMESKPIIAATDVSSDVGTIAANNGFGLWCPSNSVSSFTNAVNYMLRSDMERMGKLGFQYYLNNYTVAHTYNAIMNHFDYSPHHV